MDTDAYVADVTWKTIVKSCMRGLPRRGRGNNPPEDAKAIRDRYKHYINNADAVEWQHRMIALADIQDHSDD